MMDQTTQIADAIERCVAEMEPGIGAITPRREPAPIPTPVPFDKGAASRLIAAEMFANDEATAPS